MRKSLFLVGAVALATTHPLSAHPTNVAYETRGECEAAYAKASKFDRERLVALGIFDTQGEAQRTFNEIFRCEYDQDDDAWYIVFVGGM